MMKRYYDIDALILGKEALDEQFIFDAKKMFPHQEIFVIAASHNLTGIPELLGEEGDFKLFKVSNGPSAHEIQR